MGQARTQAHGLLFCDYVKNKLLDDEETITEISTNEQREELTKLSRDAEDWLFDEGDTADLETIQAKYDELATPAEQVWFRLKEMTERPAAVKMYNITPALNNTTHTHARRLNMHLWGHDRSESAWVG